MRTCTLPTAFAESVAALSQRRGFSESLACTKKPRWIAPAGLCILARGVHRHATIWFHRSGFAH
jgi:hypothetical protein